MDLIRIAVNKSLHLASYEYSTIKSRVFISGTGIVTPFKCLYTITTQHKDGTHIRKVKKSTEEYPTKGGPGGRLGEGLIIRLQ